MSKHKHPHVLTRDALGSAGITYHEEPIEPEALLKECPQASVLTQFLLDFKHIIAPERWEELDSVTRHESEGERARIVIPEKRPHAQAHDRTRQIYERRYNITRCDANFGLASDIKEKAECAVSKDEDRWTNVVKCAFGRLEGGAHGAERNDFPRTAADVISRYRVETNHTWEFGRSVLREYSQKTKSKLKAPKPDLYLSFHAYMQGKAECGPLNGEDYIENFGMSRLNTLHKKYIIMADKRPDLPFGFNPSPCRKVYSADSVKDRTCFPWAVCEWKHHGKINTSYEEYLHCQAANAAAVCLTLFANAATGGRPSPVISEIRPVVCMTFTGPRTKVWIAYVTEIEEARYKYRMRCIWKGSLHNVLDNIKLCVIIENLHFWAMNHLRPWLSSCIDQWKRSIDESEAENNRSKPEISLNDQPVKPNQSKARVPLFTFAANQSKTRSPLFSQNTASNYSSVRIQFGSAEPNYEKARYTCGPGEPSHSKMRSPLQPIDPGHSKASSSFGGGIVQKDRSKQLDSYGRFNFALRRANTLESCLDQDEDHASSDGTFWSSDDDIPDSSEEYDKEEEEEESGEELHDDGDEEESEEDLDDDEDEDKDGDDEYLPGSEDEKDEELEDKIDIAMEQLRISLRNDKRGRQALDDLEGYWCANEK